MQNVGIMFFDIPCNMTSWRSQDFPCSFLTLSLTNFECQDDTKQLCTRTIFGVIGRIKIWFFLNISLHKEDLYSINQNQHKRKLLPLKPIGRCRICWRHFQGDVDDGTRNDDRPIMCSFTVMMSLNKHERTWASVARVRMWGLIGWVWGLIKSKSNLITCPSMIDKATL